MAHFLFRFFFSVSSLVLVPIHFGGSSFIFFVSCWIINETNKQPNAIPSSDKISFSFISLISDQSLVLIMANDEWINWQIVGSWINDHHRHWEKEYTLISRKTQIHPIHEISVVVRLVPQTTRKKHLESSIHLFLFQDPIIRPSSSTDDVYEVSVRLSTSPMSLSSSSAATTIIHIVCVYLLTRIMIDEWSGAVVSPESLSSSSGLFNFSPSPSTTTTSLSVTRLSMTDSLSPPIHPPFQ